MFPKPADDDSYTTEDFWGKAILKHSLTPRVLSDGRSMLPTDDKLVPRIPNPPVLSYPYVRGWLMHPEPEEPTFYSSKKVPRMAVHRDDYLLHTIEFRSTAVTPPIWVKYIFSNPDHLATIR